MGNRRRGKGSIHVVLGSLALEGHSGQRHTNGDSKIFKNNLSFHQSVLKKWKKEHFTRLHTGTLFKTTPNFGPQFYLSRLWPKLCCLFKTCLPVFPYSLVYFLFPGVSSCPFSSETFSPFSLFCPPLFSKFDFNSLNKKPHLYKLE